jgi:hypothetical protein
MSANDILRRMFVESPNSKAIANTLTLTRRHVCQHGNGECFLRCGVRYLGVWDYDRGCLRAKRGPANCFWEVISQDERLAWLESQMAETEQECIT